MLHQPMPLVPEAFDHPDWIFELKHDGFRALAYVEGHLCRLVSRRGREFPKFGVLAEEIAHSVKHMSAILDGEIVVLDLTGEANSTHCCLGASGRITRRNGNVSPTARPSGHGHLRPRQT